MTIITNKRKEAILPSAKELKKPNGYVCKIPHAYNLYGTSHKSPELIFRDLPKKVSVSHNQEMQIWYGQDWINCSEDHNIVAKHALMCMHGMFKIMSLGLIWNR